MKEQPGSQSGLPSPLEGEGGASAPGEGPSFNRRHKEWRTAFTRTLRSRARQMRTEPTEGERRLWGIVRDRRLVGFKFRRQVPMGRYIVDFYCPRANLIVELDGSQHADDPGDKSRDAWLAAQGYRMLRIWNNQLAGDRDAVLDLLWTALTAPSPGAARHPLPQGEREEREAPHAR